MGAHTAAAVATSWARCGGSPVSKSVGVMALDMPPGSETGWSRDRGDTDDGATSEAKEYELLAWVKASDHRQEILSTLAERPENTTHFKEEWGVSTADVPRRYLKELQQRGLVECLTPQKTRYRLYGLTDWGEDMAEKL